MIQVEVVPVGAPFGRHELRRAGRSAVTAALRRAGCTAPTVGRRADGVPVFPAGFAAALSHTAELAVAVAARGLPGIGVDLETARPDPRVAALLLDAEERARLWPDCAADTLVVRLAEDVVDEDIPAVGE